MFRLGERWRMCVRYALFILVIVENSALAQLDVTWERFSVVTKSYIASFEIDDERLSIPLKAVAASVAVGTIGFDAPKGPAYGDGEYRLRSEVLYEVACINGPVVKVVRASKDGSNEMLVFLTTVEWYRDKPVVNQVYQGIDIFRHQLRGKPNVAANMAMAAATPRGCEWIWHKVEVRFKCESGRPRLAVSLHGSVFPSHKVWVDNVEVAYIPQSHFSALWQCSRSDGSNIRGTDEYYLYVPFK